MSEKEEMHKQQFSQLAESLQPLAYVVDVALEEKMGENCALLLVGSTPGGTTAWVTNLPGEQLARMLRDMIETIEAGESDAPFGIQHKSIN